jgi:hypothetical protein
MEFNALDASHLHEENEILREDQFVVENPVEDVTTNEKKYVTFWSNFVRKK